MKPTILFDLDGTLIDSTEAILESFYFAFNEQNFNYTQKDQEIINLIGYPLEYMFEHLGVEKELIQEFITSYKKHYRKISQSKTSLLENAKEAVILANSFATLGVVTTKTTRYSIPLLQELQLWDYFQIIVGRQEVTNPKPHPEPIFKACELLNVTPSKNIFMIGDTKLDLIAANKAGISSIGVLCGYGNKKELSIYSPYVFKNPLEAVKLIKTLSSKA